MGTLHSSAVLPFLLILPLLFVAARWGGRRCRAAARHADAALLDTIFSATDTLIVMIDRQGCLTRMNRAAEAFTGCRLDEAKAPFHWRRFLPPEQREAVEAVFQKAVQGDIVSRFENEWVRADGTRRLFDWTNNIIRDDAGEMLYLVTIGTDVTDRTLLSTRLRLFSNAVEQVPLAVLITDLEGRIDYANPFVRTVSGYDMEELRGRPAAVLGNGGPQPPDLWPSLRAGRIWSGDFLNRRKDGGAYWLATTIFPVTDDDGALTHYVSIGEDVTERRRSQTALAEAHAQLEAVLDNTPVGIAIIALDRTLLRINRAFAETFGLSRGEGAGLSTRLFYGSDAEFEALGRAAYPEVEAGRTFTAQVPMRRQDDGRLITVTLAARLINEAAPALGVVWSAEDITERLAAEKRLAQANEDLAQFAYVASHDLRQPLRMVSSYVALIERHLGDAVDADLKSFITFARDGAKRMDALILGLLEYSRTGRSANPWRDVALDEVVEQCLHDLQMVVAESQAEVRVAAGLPHVTGDAIDLARLFQNLIGNALKYHRPGSSPRIDIGWEDEGDYWRVTVRDNGIGIASESCERVFGIFQRLVTQEQYEGTGIGLAVCRKIAETHGGRIWVEPLPDVGSRFCVTFPKAARGG